MDKVYILQLQLNKSATKMQLATVTQIYYLEKFPNFTKSLKELINLRSYKATLTRVNNF